MPEIHQNARGCFETDTFTVSTVFSDSNVKKSGVHIYVNVGDICTYVCLWFRLAIA